MFAGVISQALQTSSVITKRLATYQKAPAIFTGGLPDDAKYPAILLVEAGGKPWGCRDRRGTETVIEVRVCDNKEFTRKAISDLARLVWQQLDRLDVTPWIVADGFECWDCQADEPGYVDDGLSFPGYLIRVQLRALEILPT